VKAGGREESYSQGGLKMGITERWKGFRKLPPDIKQVLTQLIPLFEKEGVLLAYLFGSLSERDKGQDVDLAILVRDAPAFHLREAIVECLGTERVDLVDLGCAPPGLRFEIIRTGQPLYVADQEIQERFELATLHLYRDTLPLRRQQRDYLKRRMGL
jgi:predicted nucleotidyltransferase